MIAGYSTLVSVVIPVYNGANFLAKAIDSALEQTYENIEIIVINDGASDDGATQAIIETYHPKIRSFSKPNGGVASALNLGIRAASGEFVSWLSHDDEYLPGKIQSQIDVLAKRSMKSVVYGGYQLIDSKSRVIGTIDPAELIVPQKLEDPLYPLMRMLIHGCSLLIPREAFFDIGMFDESLVHTQDYTLWFEIFRAYGLVYDPNICTLSRIHINQSNKTVRGQISEGDALWIGFVSKLTTDEMTRMSGSEFEFYRELAYHLSLTPHRKAHANVKLLETNAWKSLADNNLTATISPQFQFPDFIGSQRWSSSLISIHALKLFFLRLRRFGMKETMRVTNIHLKQRLKRKFLHQK